jgi:hypothetical protein
MQYKVFMQDKEMGIIEADNTGQALAIVAKKLEDNEYQIDQNKPNSIKLQPV